MDKLYLYVKQHKLTGLKYFGMTATKDPYVYLGSGKYWRRHLKTHGKDIETISVWEFTDSVECEKFALEFSEKNNIVESVKWANLRPENGKDGKAPGSPGMKRENNPNWGKVKEQNSFFGKKHKPETIELYKKQKTGGNNPRARKLTTPNGQYACIKDALRVERTSPEVLKNKLNNNHPGYHWGW
jgi:hypothetical protein